MAIVTPSDFVGKFAISRAFNDGTSKIQEYIDVYEQKYMNEMLGVAMYADFTTNITDPLNVFILDPFAVDGVRYPIVSEGMKTMLKYFIYAHYQAEEIGISTSVGHVKPAIEGGSLQTTNDDNNILTFYNQGVKTHKAIRKYLKENLADYPLFKGVDRDLNWFR